MPVIASNTAANTALRYLNINQANQSDSLAKLSSGSRIQRASDDASGLAVATSMAADISVLEQAATNTSSAQAVLQTADGALSNLSDILQRMKSLTAQSQTGTVSDTERGYIDAEYQELLSEVDAIASGTKFNGEALLDGTGAYGSGVDFLVGTDTTDVLTVTLSDVSAAGLSVDGTSVDTAANAATAMDAIDAALGIISNERASVGAMISRFSYRADVIDSSLENLEAAKSSIMDVDIAAEQTEFTNAQTLTSAAISALGQANSMNQQLLKLLQ